MNSDLDVQTRRELPTVSVSRGSYSKTPTGQGLQQQTLMSHGSGGQKSKTKVPADPVLCEGPLPGLLCPRVVERELWSLFLSLQGH